MITNQKLAQFICEDIRPLSLIEGKGFNVGTAYHYMKNEVITINFTVFDSEEVIYFYMKYAINNM